ncbi:MAG: choice-of-anchor A family protein [Planctomycetota bacterium]
MTILVLRSLRCLVILCGLVAVGGPASASSITGFNLVVFGDLDSNSEVEGKAFVGGDLLGPASNYGTMLTLPADEVSLAVGGNIFASNVNISAGAVNVDGDIGMGTNLNMNSGGDYAVGGAILGNVNNGTEVASLDVPTLGQIESFYRSLSNSYASLTPNSSCEIDGGFRALYAADPSVVNELAVFELTASQAFDLPSTVSQLAVALNNANGIVINILGDTVSIPNTLNPVGEILSDAVRERLVWNFPEATSIDINPNFNGMVLAPNAALSNITAIDGQVIVDSFVQRGEVHLPLSVIIPEPAAGAYLLIALGFAAGWRRRSHR